MLKIIINLKICLQYCKLLQKLFKLLTHSCPIFEKKNCIYLYIHNLCFIAHIFDPTNLKLWVLSSLGLKKLAKQTITNWAPVIFDKKLQENNQIKKIENVETNVPIIFRQRYWWSENPGIWLAHRNTWLQSTKSAYLKFYLLIQKLKLSMVLSSFIADSRSLQCD